MEERRGSLALSLASGGWLLFGFIFSASLCLGAIKLRWLAFAGLGVTALTTILPVVALGLGGLDLLRGQPGGARAVLIAGLHLFTVVFLVGVIGLVVATSR
jgi:hypothetical protein